MDTETNEPTPRKLYYVEGYFETRTHYAAWIKADSKEEAEDIAGRIDSLESEESLRGMKSHTETEYDTSTVADEAEALDQFGPEIYAILTPGHP
jgi:heme-degrading monooxygenase HmoA